MIDLSRYHFEALRNDEEFILYRGQREEDASRVPVLAPAAHYPRPESLKRLEHEYSFREELDPGWAARPIGLARHWTVQYWCWKIPVVSHSINCWVTESGPTPLPFEASAKEGSRPSEI